MQNKLRWVNNKIVAEMVDEGDFISSARSMMRDVLAREREELS